MKDRVYIDFEFCHPEEVNMGLICCALKVDKGDTERYWLLDGSDNDRLVSRLLELEHCTFVAYNVDMAEGRCFRALGLHPAKFRWNDLMIDWRWLRNGDDRYSFGNVIIKKNADKYDDEYENDGVDKHNFTTAWSVAPLVKITKRMTPEEIAEANQQNRDQCRSEARTNGRKVVNKPAGFGLLDAEYFFSVIGEDEVIDAFTTKESVRSYLIIANRNNPDKIQENKETVLDYCSSDIGLLRELDEAIDWEMHKVANENHLFVMDGTVCSTSISTIRSVDDIRLDMGVWAARLAMYSSRGIPLDKAKYEAVKAAVPQITSETQLAWNKDHPDFSIYRIGPDLRTLRTRKAIRKKSPYKNFNLYKDEYLEQDFIRKYCAITGVQWPTTAKGSFTLKGDVLKEMDDGNIISEFRKHRDSLTAIKAMAVQKDGSVKLDQSIGKNYKQHPNFGPYGTKSGRNATKASTFVFLGPKWFRIMVNPREGTYLCDLDAHSEEVAIAAALYNDENKREVYRSADVYMQYAQLAGAYPKDKPILTEDERDSEKWFKEEGWGRVRKMYKSGFLGMQYGMGAGSLQRRVALSLPPKEREALPSTFGETFVEEYHNTFNSEFVCVSELKHQYRKGVCSGVVLCDGWRVGPDDPNVLAVGNFPVQGTGAVILRKCCELCDEAGIKIYATLHDAISITGKVENMKSDIETASECFRKAAEYVLGEDLMKVGNPEIVRHGDVWLHDADCKGVWNNMASKYFKDFVIKDDK